MCTTRVLLQVWESPLLGVNLGVLGFGCRKQEKLKGLARDTMMALSSSRKLVGWLGAGG